MANNLNIKPACGARINNGNPISKGLVGAWLMNEGRGGIVSDMARTSDGSFTSSAWAPGRYGIAANFNASTSEIDCGSNDYLDDMGPLTFGIWCYPKSAGGGSLGRLFDKNNITNFLIRTVGTGQPSTLALFFSIITSDQPLSFARATSDNFVVLNKWQFFCVTWNGSFSDPTNIKIYKDGIEASYGFSNAGTLRTSDAAGVFAIGNRQTDHTRAFDGYISHAYVWNRQLSPTEVSTLNTYPFLPVINKNNNRVSKFMFTTPVAPSGVSNYRTLLGVGA